MTTFLTNQDFSFGGSDPSRPDYVCAAFNEMAPRWQLVEDVRGGTATLRLKKETYLPKFEAETVKDWDGRVLMTFVADHYATTLTEHVGLVMAVPPKLGDDVPEQIRALTEDFDGEGNHFDVFAWDALEKSMHLGHGVLLTDYPVPDSIKDLNDQRRAEIRPYATFYRACEVHSWQWAAIGGVQVIVQIVLRETGAEPAGEFGVKDCVHLREFKQQVFYNEFTGRATGLGAITWRTWKEDSDPTSKKREHTPTGNGVIIGPERIPVRVVYGGERLGILHSKPHLIGLAFSNVEETQVGSDYASVMHKCNVPTPIFIGRNAGDGTNQTVQMGQGIDIPVGGDAKMLEPAGTAIAATRTRLQDIQAQMRRQGATMDDATGTAKTAAEARLYAKQRNAKIARAARSLQDALEGVLEDMAAFLGIKDGGSVTINQDFAGEGLDPALLTVFLNAYIAGAIPLDALMYALEKGYLPEDFQKEDAALRLVAEQIAAEDQRLAQEKKRLEAPPAPATDPAIPAAA